MMAKSVFFYQVEVKRTVPREDMEGVGVLKTKKIFVGGIPQFFTDGIVNLPYHFFQIIWDNGNWCISSSDHNELHCR